ncbi:MAG TPA: MtrB/PioB family outer membrane beta-barrel protein [Dissulfurispiraceae bacterium]|nr:MtrB/PioB family outer membrane beta-barrel protein [Dissulfurispiraceae bacterium]
MKIIRKIAATVLFLLLPFAGAFGEDEIVPSSGFSGEVGATGQIASVSGSRAKFNEYRDLRKNGIFGNVKLNYDSEDWWMKVRATDPAYDDQFYRLDGGLYGVFKADAYYNEIIHNTTSGALTPYAGVGSNYLTTPLTANRPSNRNTATWNSFDYSIQRKQYGGDIKLDVLNPFYVNFSVSREDRNGVLPWSNGNAIEIPAPVNYQTTDYVGEVGYRANPVFAGLTFAYSQFDNANETLFISGSGPINNSTAALMTLPPDNHYYKLGFKGVLQLPLRSRLNVSLDDKYQRSSVDLSSILAFDNGQSAANSQTALSSTNFTGRKHVQNYSFSLTSNPVRFFDLKLYYKYYSSKDTSDTITQTLNVGQASQSVVIVPLFSYKKNQYGGDFGFKLPAQFHLNAGYAYIDTDRFRPDIPRTKDSIYSAGLRWDGLDFLTPKIGYEHLMREAHLGSPYALDSSVSHQNFPQFVAFDATKQRKDTYKFAIDSTPLPNLNLGAAYKYKQSTFPDDFLGVQKAKGHELDLYGDYSFGSFAKVNAYFDLQNAKQYLVDQNGGTAATVGSSPSNSIYMWNTTIKDNTYAFGAGTDVYLVPKKLTLRLQYDYVNSDGNEDFSFLFPGIINGVNANTATGPIGNPSLSDIDSYRKSSFLCKLSLAVSKQISVAVGGVIEHFRYSDFALSNPNYQYVVGTNFFTGANANPSYNASIGFVSLAYKF